MENILGVGFRHVYDALDHKINTQNIQITEFEDDIDMKHTLLNNLITELKHDLIKKMDDKFTQMEDGISGKHFLLNQNINLQNGG